MTPDTFYRSASVAIFIRVVFLLAVMPHGPIVRSNDYVTTFGEFLRIVPLRIAPKPHRLVLADGACLMQGQDGGILVLQLMWDEQIRFDAVMRIDVVRDLLPRVAIQLDLFHNLDVQWHPERLVWHCPKHELHVSDDMVPTNFPLRRRSDRVRLTSLVDILEQVCLILVERWLNIRPNTYRTNKNNKQDQFYKHIWHISFPVNILHSTVW